MVVTLPSSSEDPHAGALKPYQRPPSTCVVLTVDNLFISGHGPPAFYLSLQSAIHLFLLQWLMAWNVCKRPLAKWPFTPPPFLLSFLNVLPAISEIHGGHEEIKIHTNQFPLFPVCPPKAWPLFIGISSFSSFKIKASNASCFQSERSLLIPGCMTDSAEEIAMWIAFSGNWRSVEFLWVCGLSVALARCSPAPCQQHSRLSVVTPTRRDVIRLARSRDRFLLLLFLVYWKLFFFLLKHESMQGCVAEVLETNRRDSNHSKVQTDCCERRETFGFLLHAALLGRWSCSALAAGKSMARSAPVHFCAHTVSCMYDELEL